MTVPVVVETDSLTKRYGSSRGIEEISLAVEPGEVFGLLGPNGAGKTTLIRTLLDLLHPTSGSARIFGLDTRRDSVAIRERLGNLPGDFSYGPPKLTGREILGLFAKIRGIDGLGVAEALAGRFHADLDRPIGHLSRGNRQKIGLLIALFHAPELVILDEPTSGFDPLMQEQFHALVDELRDAGRTLVVSSHDLAEVERICDRVGMIREGRLIAVERVADLIGKSYRSVALRFAEPVAGSELASIPGVEDVRVADGEISFRATGELDPIVKAAARHTIVDMRLRHPSLEEVFLTHYEGGSRSSEGDAAAVDPEAEEGR